MHALRGIRVMMSTDFHTGGSSELQSSPHRPSGAIAIEETALS